MICVLSPAKTMISASALMAVSNSSQISSFRTLPSLLNEANIIGNVLKSKNNKQIKDIYGLSANLTNHVNKLCKDYQTIDKNTNFDQLDLDNFNQAVAMFNGPAFQGLDQASLGNMEKELLQRHLRILTGLYGDLKPFDTIQEHRLCMSTKLNINNNKDLYSYWGNIIAISITNDIKSQLLEIKKEIEKNNETNTKLNSKLKAKGKGKGKELQLSENILPLIINCASQEYYKSISGYLVDLELNNEIMIIECVFLDKGMIKSVYAKRARGLMARYVCTHGGIKTSQDVELIKGFNIEGYKYSATKSSATQYVFDRNSIPNVKMNVKTTETKPKATTSSENTIKSEELSKKRKRK